MSERTQQDLMPPAGWEPKSSFFKAIMERVDTEAHNKQWHLQCPDCGHHIDLQVRIPEPLFPRH
jgi:hypothetical protein